jgi:serine/threonine protein kinase
VAPEIIEGKPYKGEPSDFWSCGIVLYIMLSGDPPFFDEDNFLLFEKIKKCEYNFDAPIWKQISVDARDLVSKLLVADPEKRLKANEVLSHPWFSRKEFKMPVDVIEKAKNWDTQRKLAMLS